MIYLENNKIKNIKFGAEQIQKITAGIQRVWENWVHKTGALVNASCGYSGACSYHTGADRSIDMPGEIRIVRVDVSVTASITCSGDLGGCTCNGYAYVTYTDGTTSGSASAGAGVANHDHGQHVGERMSSTAHTTLYPDPNKIVSKLNVHCNYGNGEYCGDGSINAIVVDWWSKG